MALLNKPKLKKGEATQQKNSMSVDQAKAKILAARAAKTGGTSGSTSGGQQLSAGAVANLAKRGVGVNAQGFGYSLPKTTKAPSTNSGIVGSALNTTSYLLGQSPRSVGGGYGGGTGGSWGSPKLEFSVLPGAKAGPVSLGYMGTPKTSSAQSTLNPQTPEEFARVQEDARKGRMDMITAATLPLGLGGGAVARTAGTAVKNAPKWTSILNAAKTKGDDVFNTVKNLFKSGTDDALRQADDIVRATADDAASTFFRNTVTAAIRTSPTRAVISSLGALGAGMAVGSAISGSGGAGTVRNAVPEVSGTQGGQTGTESVQTGGAQRSAESASIQSSDLGMTDFSALSSSFGGASVGGGAPAGGTSGGQTGYGGAAALRGENMTPEQAAAQAKAMALGRAQVDQAGVNAAPVGEQVDLAKLQGLRDRAKEMLDQYGADAVTMPEFKANVQALIAAGVENMKKLQPSPPVPVVETEEQADFVGQTDETQQQDVRAFMDSTRKALGLPDLERNRIEVMQQLQVVQETYQKVIDQIKENPNLPKGLAARRLTEVFEDQKFAANQLLAQLEIIDQQIEDGNNRLNQEFGIFKYQADQAEAAQQRRVDQLGYLAESGAIGSLTDKEISQWAAATGIPETAIKAMRTKATDVKTSWDISYEQNPNTGEKFAIYTDKNNPVAKPVVVSLGSYGVKTSGGGTRDEKVITEEKDLTRSIRTDLIDTIKANPTASIDQLEGAFPEVSRPLIEQYLDQYGTPATQTKETFWDKVGNWWTNLTS